MIDDRAYRGFKSAEAYDACRPSYPPAAVTFIREAAGIDERSTVVDLAAGTGLMTRLLSPAGRLVAIEPVAEMRALLQDRVPEAEVLEGTAERMPLPAAVADAVIVAQAFHWFANLQAVREISRVLKPEGALALVWNESDPRDPLLAAIDKALAPYRLDSPRSSNTPWRDVLSTDDSPLVITRHMTVASEEELTFGLLKGRVRSYSYIAVLGGPAQATVMDVLDAAARSVHRAAMADDAKLVVRHLTEVYIARHRYARQR